MLQAVTATWPPELKMPPPELAELPESVAPVIVKVPDGT